MFFTCSFAMYVTVVHGCPSFMHVITNSPVGPLRQCLYLPRLRLHFHQPHSLLAASQLLLVPLLLTTSDSGSPYNLIASSVASCSSTQGTRKGGALFKGHSSSF